MLGAILGIVKKLGWGDLGRGVVGIKGTEHYFVRFC